MVTIYNIKKSEMINHPNGEVFYLLELRGLSTDDKPKTIANGTIENGSVFIEIDTGDVYLYDISREEWNPVVEEEAQEEVQEESKSLEKSNERSEIEEIEELEETLEK